MPTYTQSPEFREFIAFTQAVTHQVMAWMEANRPALKRALANARQLLEQSRPPTDGGS